MIRRATVDDAVAIAGVHVRAWRWAYRGIIPDDVLAAMSLPEREEKWREHFGRDDGAETFVAEEGARVLGFCTIGAARDEGLDGGVGEVQAIYLDEDAAGRGVGRALLAVAIARLRERGYVRAILWVLEHNPRARRFYEAAGWRPDGAARTTQRPTYERSELRYAIDLTSAMLEP
ncbi:MAG TPA: GNAT family N-acetyltransferase [Polyangia bacterium]